MRKFFIVTLAVFSLFFMVVSCQHKSKPVIDKSIENIKPEGTEFRQDGALNFLDSNKKLISSIAIEIAETDLARAQGLMYREKMDADKGMLFIMEREEPQNFWMKNTILPLDIIYVSEAMKIVNISPDAVPYSEAQIPSEAPAKYVVEVNAGYAKQHNLKKGDIISFERNR